MIADKVFGGVKSQNKCLQRDRDYLGKLIPL